MERMKLSNEHIAKLTEWYGPDVEKWPVKEICLIQKELKDSKGNFTDWSPTELRKFTKEEMQLRDSYAELAELEKDLKKSRERLKQIEQERRNYMAEEPKPEPPPPPNGNDD